MTVKNVGSLAKGAVVTTASAARHPIGSAARMVGLVKGGAGASVSLVRAVVHGPARTPQQREATPAQESSPAQEATPVPDPQPVTTIKAPPGPDVVPKPVLTFDELPEPIVISAADADNPEPVHTEPKAASRGSAHGGPAGDREEGDGYLEEIEDHSTS